MDKNLEYKHIPKRDYHFFAKNPLNKILETFQITTDGLSDQQIATSREKYGENIIEHGEKTPIIIQAIKAYITPFTVILMILAVISFVTGYVLAAPEDKDLVGVIIILVMIAVSGTMTFIQSVRSTQAAEKLNNMVKVTAAVRREGKFQEIPIEKIVCGDMVHLSAGDMIPADIRLVQTKDLFVSQAAMTGESYPVEKRTDYELKEDGVETDYENIVFMGSNVISGSAQGIVISVGNDTLFGKISQDVGDKSPQTSFEIGISKTVWLLIRFMAVMVTIVFIINGLTKGDWLQAFLFSVSVAVGLTPEMLPMIVTTSLVKGASAMAKKGTIIKNLNAIQNFGAIDILCTDKTGTLTQDKVILEYHLDCNGTEDDRVLRHAFFNSYYQTGLKNLLDIAIIDAAKDHLTIQSEDYKKVDEIPFDFQRRRMSVVIEDKNGKTQMITKGAVEEMLEVSSFVDYKGSVAPLTEELKKEILRTVETLNGDGLRVLAVSQKTNPGVVGEFSISDENEMVLIGYLAFLDPPKETTQAALKALKKHGVGVKVLTGDNGLVTKAVCKQVGLGNETVISGNVLAKMNETELRETVEKNNIFVKLTPQQKTQLVEILREAGHTVGFMGDGINDAPAMKAADVGISVDTAVDIAKESADVILLDKDLMILERGILSGRKTFGNIMKYIKMTASSNFGNMFSVVVSSTFLPFIPMLPLQVLFLNLIYDISCTSIPWDNVDSEYLEQPKKWEANTIGSFIRCLGPTSSIFDITTYIAMYFVICPQIAGGNYHDLTPKQQLLFIAVFHAGWFIESLWSQTLVIHALRTPKIPFLQSHASLMVTSITTIGIAIGTILPFTMFGQRLGLAALPMSYFALLIATVIAYLLLVMFIKKIYIHHFGDLL
ncbi:magnesium-transporting ATPase, P-type 1 [Melissococcus plutonius]|uniref:magnesium-translocating P-type ATPase n=1 Tax=Melissococcus plutonius TaxID=33970 RepID=UPI00065E519E|nr:magnesium-translocating P-type ATPase [Melissococcus plutonius]AIM24849.1 magnesium-transporting ATPase, P-type 1 [Melissococcus plutonius S1]KMT24979.1 magnesium-transporting ATPase, P-type 1 [Melissococcus plutonius]KMT26615.1 magnesium-transporting ATPase, P-type 1 [Melissococcus plutonius]KMT27865.1 magnesium-transporting ATPase, P-type 1 [Melissococcus plutonius]KMT29638.1 magnesium-transporting ATPase, P-type 1 [Melissococcus plutonius]